jgi:hypothetical protein
MPAAWNGARVSPLAVFFVLLIACPAGIPLGVMAGYFGGGDPGHLVALVRAADPRPGRVGGRAPLRRELPRARDIAMANHRVARPAQRDHAADHAQL